MRTLIVAVLLFGMAVSNCYALSSDAERIRKLERRMEKLEILLEEQERQMRVIVDLLREKSIAGKLDHITASESESEGGFTHENMLFHKPISIGEKGKFQRLTVESVIDDMNMLVYAKYQDCPRGKIWLCGVPTAGYKKRDSVDRNNMISYIASGEETMVDSNGKVQNLMRITATTEKERIQKFIDIDAQVKQVRQNKRNRRDAKKAEIQKAQFDAMNRPKTGAELEWEYNERVRLEKLKKEARQRKASAKEDEDRKRKARQKKAQDRIKAASRRGNNSTDNSSLRTRSR